MRPRQPARLPVTATPSSGSAPATPGFLLAGTRSRRVPVAADRNETVAAKIRRRDRFDGLARARHVIRRRRAGADDPAAGFSAESGVVAAQPAIGANFATGRRNQGDPGPDPCLGSTGGAGPGRAQPQQASEPARTDG